MQSISRPRGPGLIPGQSICGGQTGTGTGLVLSTLIFL